MIDSVGRVIQALGAGVRIPAWDIVLPVGISFYTFHTITYIVDSYRGVIRPTRNLFEFSAYVSLFSQLVAGPIVRFRQIEEDLENLGHADRRRWLGLGVSFFITGLLEKVLVADTLARYVDPRWQATSTSRPRAPGWPCWATPSSSTSTSPGTATWPSAWATCSACGSRSNFNSPYKALDPSDFWRRWHISLSSCLRDYLYIPLGGNRQRELADHRNLMITMLLGGLWHGANWTFVVWGGLPRSTPLGVPPLERSLGPAARARPPAGDVRRRRWWAGCSSARPISRWRGCCCARCSCTAAGIRPPPGSR